MAENKKGFLLYADNYGLIKQLPDDVAGRLLKHIFSFVNDENPTSDELLLNIAFEPFKMQLKRDLAKYEIQLNQRKEAGKRSAEVRKQNATTVNDRSISSTDNVSVTDNDTVTDTDSDNDILLKKETKTNNIFFFEKSLIEYGFRKNLVFDWLKVRKTKKATNTKTAFDSFIREIESRNCDINEMLEIAVKNSWSGFKHEWVDNLKNKSQNGPAKSNTEIAVTAFNSETAKNFRYSKGDY